MPARSISLTRELWLAIRSLQGLRLLCDYWHDLPVTVQVTREIPSAVSASLTLIEARISLLQGVVAGEVNPALLWCRENAATEPVEGDPDDICLAEWTSKRAMRKAREELERATRQRERERQARQREAEGERDPS